MALFRTGLYVKNHSVEKVQIAKTPIASYNGNVTGLYIPELIAYIEAKQSGSGTPSPDNIRPIIGWSECNVTRCGKNLFDKTTATLNTRVNTSGTSAYPGVDCSAFIKVPTGDIYISNVCGVSLMAGIYIYNKDKEYVRYESGGTTTLSKKITIASDECFIRLNINHANVDICQVEIGNTATAYEAYNGNTYTIQLGDTYYGGSLDLTTGVLTVDRKFKDFDGTENWVNVGGQYPYAFQLDTYIPNIKSSPIPSQNIICNMFKQANVEVPTGDAIRWQVNTQTGRLYVYCHRYSGDLAGFKAMLAENNLQVCYVIATPFTVQLTPTQVEQLLGVNNVWADTGDVEVKFYNVVR